MWAPASLVGPSPSSRLGPKAKDPPGDGGLHGALATQGFFGGARNRLSPVGAPGIGDAPFSLVD